VHHHVRLAGERHEVADTDRRDHRRDGRIPLERDFEASPADRMIGKHAREVSRGCVGFDPRPCPAAVSHEHRTGCDARELAAHPDLAASGYVLEHLPRPRRRERGGALGCAPREHPTGFARAAGSRHAAPSSVVVASVASAIRVRRRSPTPASRTRP
jgi:hypothetical protein